MSPLRKAFVSVSLLSYESQPDLSRSPSACVSGLHSGPFSFVIRLLLNNTVIPMAGIVILINVSD